jgi:hypothetical protein
LIQFQILTDVRLHGCLALYALGSDLQPPEPTCKSAEYVKIPQFAIPNEQTEEAMVLDMRR